MSKQKKESYFWTSFSDLMTSLFFVMLVLFVLTIALLHRKMVDIEGERKATEEQLEKITEIEKAVNNIDTNYFEYNSNYKKHILKIEARFDSDKFRKHEIIPQSSIRDLIEAGESIRDSIISISNKFPTIQYLLIIEGQASKDRMPDEHNYVLSYRRAYTLKKIWDDAGINFGRNCEVLIAGSGTGGTLRHTNEKINQRFLIHILPKSGIIEASKQRSR
jgi:outer membrane protein OmpA-like peptidoglycan-associated protein